MWCAEDAATDEYRAAEIAQTVRVGMSPGKGDRLPWRFVVPGHPHASRRR
jgi:3-methyladenine DNA glycosylase Mpg